MEAGTGASPLGPSWAVVAVECWVVLAAVLAVCNPAQGRNLADELQAVYQCSSERVDIVSEYLPDNVTVGIRVNGPSLLQVVINEEVAYREDDFGIIAFEYVSACQLFEALSRHAGSYQDILSQGAVVRTMLYSADCKAGEILKREGVLDVSVKSVFAVFDRFSHERADLTPT